MARENKWLTTKPKGEEQLKQAVESLAKTANQRLRELEKYRGAEQYSQHSSAYAYIEKLAYDSGKIRKGEEYKREFIHTGKEGKPIFSRATSKMSEKALEQEYKVLKDFLSAKTSTVKGTKEHLAKSYEAYKETQKTDVAEGRYRNYWEDAFIKHAMELFYSEMNNIFTLAEEKNLGTEEITAILSEMGITEDTTVEELEKDSITFDVLEKKMKAWQKEGVSATDGQQITIPKGL